MRNLRFLVLMFCLVPVAFAQELSGLMGNLTRPQDYSLKRVSSWDRTGGNDDARRIGPGEVLTVLDEPGPGVITHIWFTILSAERYHLKKIVLRMYWDDEATPSVETPIGDFFGLGLGEYFTYQSYPLAVGSSKALNSFFPMPFQKRARITVTNEGNEQARLFFSILIIVPTPSRCLPTPFISTHNTGKPLRTTAGPINGRTTAIRT